MIFLANDFPAMWAGAVRNYIQGKKKKKSFYSNNKRINEK